MYGMAWAFKLIGSKQFRNTREDSICSIQHWMFWLIESPQGKCYTRDGLYCISMFLLENVYKQLEIDYVSTVSSVGKEISCPYVSEIFMHCRPKICFRQFFSLDLVLNLFLIFHQIPGSLTINILPLLHHDRTVLIEVIYKQGCSESDAGVPHPQHLAFRQICTDKTRAKSSLSANGSRHFFKNLP